VNSDQAVEILHSADRELDAGHSLELVERDRFAGVGLFVAELGALVRTWYPVQERGDVACVGVGLIQRGGKQRARDCPGLDVHSVRKSRELLRPFVIERDVEAFRYEGKAYTRRHALCSARTGRRSAFYIVVCIPSGPRHTVAEPKLTPPAVP
jgi:hypothetical protein